MGDSWGEGNGYCPNRGSLIAQRLDGVEPGCLARGPDTEHDPDEEAEDDRDDHRQRLELEARSRDLADRDGHRDPEDHADEAADDRERERLDQELGEDVPTASADGLADADLPGPFAD